MFRGAAITQPALYPENYVFHYVIFDDLLEIVQLLLCVLLSEVLIFELSTGSSSLILDLSRSVGPLVNR